MLFVESTQRAREEPDPMLLSIAMNMSNGTGSNVYADGELSPQEDLYTSLDRETMLQLLQSRQRVLRASLEGSLSYGALQSNQGGVNVGQSLQGPRGGMNYGHGDSLLHNDNMEQEMLSAGNEFHNDGSMVFQVGFSETFNQMAPTIGHMANSNQPYLGGFGEHGQARAMNNSGDGNIEDELLRLLLARRQRLRSTAASFGQSLNPHNFLRSSESAPALDSGNIQSLTDDLLRTYTLNRMGDLGPSVMGQGQHMQESAFHSQEGNMQMNQHQPFPSSAAHRSNSLPISSYHRGEIHRSCSLPTRYPQETRFSQEMHRLNDTTGVIDLVDAPERIEPMALSVGDIMMRDHVKMRDQQNFLNADDQKRHFFDARQQTSSRSINFGQLEGFDFGPADGSPKMPQDTSPRKRKKSPRKKPADMPRRPLSAYNLFFSEERERILHELSEETDISSGDQTPIETSSEVKSNSSEEEDDNKKQPASPMDDSGSRDMEEDDSPSKVKIKALMMPLIPSEKARRPHRKTHGKIGFQSLARFVGERWRNLPEERRKYYQDLAKEDMKRQKIAMDEYYRKQEAEKGKKIATDDDRAKGGLLNQHEATDEGPMTKAAINQTEEEGKSIEGAGKSTGEVVEEVIEEAGKAILSESRPKEAGSAEEIQFLKEEEKVTEEEGTLNVAAV